MFKRILVPVDGSPPSDEAVALARQLARASGATVRVVHVLDNAAYMTGYDPAGAASIGLYDALRSSGRQLLQEAAAVFRSDGIPVEDELLDQPGTRLGDVVSTAASDWGADLLVVGTHGRSGPSRLLLGSGAEQIIRLAPVPVLVARAPAAQA